MSIDIQERTATKEELKSPPRFNLWAINNDLTSFDEVVYILTKAFGMSESVAAEITVKVDTEGKAKCNPKPMSKGLAELQMTKVNECKVNLARMIPHRALQIMMLKFMIKED